MAAKLEESLLVSTKVEKADTQAKGYENALRGNPIPFNQGFVVLVMKGNEPKKHRTRLGLKKNKPKENEGMKEKVREKIGPKV